MKMYSNDAKKKINCCHIKTLFELTTQPGRTFFFLGQNKAGKEDGCISCLVVIEFSVSGVRKSEGKDT